MNFDDIQKQASTQMHSQLQVDDNKEATRNLAQAAQNLNLAHQQQMQQMQMQMAQQQQQIQAMQQMGMSLQQSAMSNRTGAPMGPPPTAPFQSYVRPMMNTAAQLGSVGFSYAKNSAEEFRQSAVNFANRYSSSTAHSGININAGYGPSGLNLPSQGFTPSMLHGAGISWNPSNAQGYNFGAYQAAQSRNLGREAMGYTQGAMAIGAGLFTSEGMADMAINAGLAKLGPLGFVAQTLGLGNVVTDAISPITGALDRLNPVSYGIQEASRASMFGGIAGQGSNNFLRGAGMGIGRGNFSNSQMMNIGAGISNMSMRDLTYSTEDLAGLQTQFNETGQFLGVQSAGQYRDRMKKLLDTHKTVMKTLQVGTEEAVQMMDQMYSTIGVDHGPEMTRMTTKMYAAAGLAGIDPMRMAELASQGAGMAGQYGLMGSSGARLMMQSRALAGMGASSTVSTPLLASVGGEEGLAQLLATRSMGFMQGAGGSIMGLNRGMFGTNVIGAVGNATGQLRGQGDLVSFLANRHSITSNFSAEEQQSQMMMQYYGIAQQMGGAGSIRDKMVLAMGGGAQAEAMVESFMAMPQTLQRGALSSNEARNNALRDQMQEQRSISGRFELGLRDFTGNTLRGRHVMQGITGFSGRVGDAAAGYSKRLMDRVNGITGEDIYTYEGAADIMSDISSGKGPYSAGGGTSSRSLGNREVIRRAMSEDLDNATFASDAKLIRGTVVKAIQSGDTGTIKRAMKAIKSGRIRDDLMNQYTDTSDITNEDAMDLVDELGLSSSDRKKAARALGQDLVADGGISKYQSKEERVKVARKMFGIDGILDNGEVSDAELDAAVSSKDFQGFTEAIEKMWSEYDPSKDRAGQSKAYFKAEKEALALYKGIESSNPKVQQVVDKMLKGRGIEISSDRSSISMKDMAEKRIKEVGGVTWGREYQSEFIRKNKGNVFNQKETKALFESTKNNKKLEQQAAAVENAVKGLTGRNLDVSPEDLEGGVTSAISQLGSMDESDIKKLMSSNDQYSQTIGHAANLLKSGKSLTQDQMSVTGNALIAMGLGGTVGSVLQGTGELNGNVVGMEDMQKNQMNIIAQQLEITKTLKVIADKLAK